MDTPTGYYGFLPTGDRGIHVRRAQATAMEWRCRRRWRRSPAAVARLRPDGAARGRVAPTMRRASRDRAPGTRCANNAPSNVGRRCRRCDAGDGGFADQARRPRRSRSGGIRLTKRALCHDRTVFACVPCLTRNVTSDLEGVSSAHAGDLWGPPDPPCSVTPAVAGTFFPERDGWPKMRAERPTFGPPASSPCARPAPAQSGHRPLSVPRRVLDR